MALSAALETAGFVAENLTTEAEVTLERVGDAWTVTSSDLKLTATLLGIDEKTFREIADGAKKNCPVSRLLNAKVTLDAQLEPLTGP
jgi:osmotically inducible protein OsmC